VNIKRGHVLYYTMIISKLKRWHVTRPF